MTPEYTGVHLARNGEYWQACWYDTSGTRVRKGLGLVKVKNRNDAKKECRTIEAAFGGKAPGTNGHTTLLAWAKTYLSELRVSDGRLANLTRAYDLLMALGDRPLSAITLDEASRWRASLADPAGPAGHTLSETTICSVVKAARQLFAQALRRELTTRNPFLHLSCVPPMPDQDWPYITVDDTQRLIAACPSPAWACLIALCRWGGLRRGEALRLTWGQIAGSRIRVANATGHVTTKAKSRQVPVTQRLSEVLTANRPATAADADLVCAGITSPNWHLRAIVKKAGLDPKKAGLHLMRKACATDWKQEFPEFAVDRWLGHSMEVSRRHYLTVPDEIFARASGGPNRA